MNNENAAFSLVELMVVIAIIGILLTFAVPIYQNYQYKVNVANVVNKLGTFKINMVDTYTSTSSWPAAINGATAPATISVSDPSIPSAVNFRYNNASNKAWWGYKLSSAYGSGWIFMVLIANSDGSYSAHCGSMDTTCTYGYCTSSNYFPSGCNETSLSSTYSITP